MTSDMTHLSDVASDLRRSLNVLPSIDVETPYRDQMEQSRVLRAATVRLGHYLTATCPAMTTDQSKAFDMREQLKDHIRAVLEGIRHLDVDSAADLIAEVDDEIAEDRTEPAINGAILDGIRWDYHAAVTVEVGGGAMLRVILPGRSAITHEWAIEGDAQPQIKAALDALHGARVIAQGVGDE